MSDRMNVITICFVLVILHIEIPSSASTGDQNDTQAPTNTPPTILLRKLPSLESETLPTLILQRFEFSEFPFNEFYNISKTFDFYNYQCKRTLFRSDGNSKQCCECHRDCLKYGTCCIDFLWELFHIESADLLQNYLQNFIAKSESFKPIKCSKVLPISETPNKHQVETLQMVTTCTKGTNKMDTELCTNGSSTEANNHSPVLGSDDHYLYKNRFCALCNNVTQYEHVSFDVKCVNTGGAVKTKSTISLKDFDNLQECVVNLKRTPLNTNYLKSCVQQNLIADACSETDKQLCKLYSAPTVDNYKNYHCRKCDTRSDMNISIENFMKCPNRCSEPWCGLPDGKDQSKYNDTFDISISNNQQAFQVSNFRQKFPIWEFFQLPGNFQLPTNEGLEQYLCSGRRTRCCDCDKNCMQGDRKCCVDAFWNETDPIDINKYKEQLLDEADKVKDDYCLPIYPSAKSIGYDSEHYIMVQSCLRNSDPSDKFNCLAPVNDSSPSTNLPVFGADKILYKSSFCAKCNLVNFHYVNLRFDCAFFVVTEQDFQNNGTNSTLDFDIKRRVAGCEFKLQNNKDFQARTCYPSGGNSTPKRQCSFQNSNYDLCRSYYGRFGNYKNYHCHKCNNDVPTTTTASMFKYCDPPKPCRNGCSFVVGERKIEPPPRRYYRWSFTLTFSDTNSNIKFDDELGSFQSSCTQGETYDIEEAKCIKYTCPVNYKAIGLDCVANKKPKIFCRLPSSSRDRNFDSLEGKFFAAFNYHVYIVLTAGITRTDAELSQHIGGNLTFSVLTNTTKFAIKHSDQLVTLQLLKTMTNNLQLPTAVNLTMDEARIFIGPIIHQTSVSKMYGLDFSRTFSEDRLCARPSSLLSQEVISNGNVSTVHYQNKTFSMSSVSFWLYFQNNEFVREFSVCEEHHLLTPCLRKVLREVEVTQSDNMTIIHNSTSGIRSYQPHQYLPTANGYSVCLNNTIATTPRVTNQDLDKLYEVEYYISIVATSVSVVCYIWIIVTYVMFKDLRTIPGMNNCFLCVSLLIADVMFLSAAEASTNTNSCISIAVVMHWGLLAAFTWTLIISFDLVSRFGSFSMRSRNKDLKGVRYRAAVGFLGPAIVVSIATSLDRAGKANIGYGAQNICWITNSQARLGLYIIPTGTAIFIALASLCYTVWKISKEKKKGENYLGTVKGSRVNFTRMAVKLAMILGVTEIIGYVQIPASNPTSDQETFNATFGFVYSVVRSLRGVMLWFVYIYSGPIMKRFKKRVQRSARRSPRSDNIYTTSTMTLTTLTTDDSSNRKISSFGS